MEYNQIYTIAHGFDFEKSSFLGSLYRNAFRDSVVLSGILFEQYCTFLERILLTISRVFDLTNRQPQNNVFAGGL